MNAMGCNLIEKAGSYLDGAMNSAERQTFDAHLTTCLECSAEVARIERLSRFIASAEMPAPENLVMKFRMRKNNQKRLVRMATILTGAAAAVLIVTTLSMILHPSDSTPASMSWQTVAVSQQIDASSQSDPDDPIAQLLLQERP